MLVSVVETCSLHSPQPYKGGTAAEGTTVLVIGGGPCGLRMAVECLMLGCRVVVVEKRRSYSRNNVLHLWPFTITDLKRLGAKKFYGKFCAGSLDHISEWASLGAWLGGYSHYMSACACWIGAHNTHTHICFIYPPCGGHLVSQVFASWSASS